MAVHNVMAKVSAISLTKIEVKTIESNSKEDNCR
jgi:hypothetical protein